MRKILEKVANTVPATLAVTLEHSDRQKSRGLLKLDDGSEAALLLERGTGLQHGDRLLADDGAIVVVQAALEGLSNVALQLSALRLAYRHDHVLDDMVRELGFQVSFAAERFEPESGAYGHGHAHASRPPGVHSHGHSYPHDHAHDHGHDQEHRPSSAGRAHALP